MTVSVYADPSGNYATMSIGGSEKFRLNSDGTATLGGIPVQRSELLTSQSTASGTQKDFSVGAWAKEVVISLSNVSTNGTALVVALLGTSAGYVTSGYAGTYQGQTLASPSNGFGGGLGLNIALSANNTAGDFRHGTVTLTHMGGNLWSICGSTGISNGSNYTTIVGSVQLPGVLNSIRITTNGSDNFDGGSVGVLVKG